MQVWNPSVSSTTQKTKSGTSPPVRCKNFPCNCRDEEIRGCEDAVRSSNGTCSSECEVTGVAQDFWCSKAAKSIRAKRISEHNLKEDIEKILWLREI